MKLIVNGTEWRDALRKFNGYDFYHTYDYHALATNGSDDRAYLFLYEGTHTAIALPLLIRRGRIGSVQFTDVTSVYGYVGPLISSDGDNKNEIQMFQQSLAGTFEDSKIVSVFSRLHPLLRGEDILQGLGSCDVAGETVSINLLEPVDVQWRKYRTNHRRDIAKLKKQGVVCEKSERVEDLAAFRTLYAHTMERHQASHSYFFSDEYFDGLVNAADFDMHLFVCRSGETVICGGLFSACQGVIQYHLGATDKKFLRQAPSKLMFDTVRLWGVSRGMHTFHLGGGVQSNRDSLYRFKRGFSDIVHEFRVWRWIVDEEAYAALNRRRDEAVGTSSSDPVDNDFFPSYRDPA